MAIIALPPLGDTDWYDYAQSLDTEARLIAGKADDTAVVKLTGDQTIAGIKTFSSAPVVPDNSFTIAKISATGTRNTTTFLRGDGTFAALPASAVTSVNTRTGAVTGLAEDNAVVHLAGSETITGGKSFSVAPNFDAGGPAANLRAGATSDHVYLTFFADSQALTTRSGYIGYGSAGTTLFTINNEMNGGINITGGNVTVTSGNLLEGVNRVYSAGNKVPVAGLSATGTASATTYLRGDNTWATLPASAVTSVNTRTGAVTGLAEDNAVVHLAGAETLTGAKTFSALVTASADLSVRPGTALATITLSDGTITKQSGSGFSFNSSISASGGVYDGANRAYSAGNPQTAIAWSGVTGKPSSWLDGATLIEGAPTDINHLGNRPSGFFQATASTNNPLGDSGWWNYINVRHGNVTNNHGFQFAAPYTANRMFFRTYSGGTGIDTGISYQIWAEVAALNLTQTWTATQTFTSPLAIAASTAVPAIVARGFPAHASDIQQWQNSAGSVLASVGVNGRGTFLDGVRAQSYVVINADGAWDSYGGSLGVKSFGPASVAIVAKASAAQTNDIMQFQNSAGAVLSRVANDGTIWVGATQLGGGSAADTEIMAIMGAY